MVSVLTRMMLWKFGQKHLKLAVTKRRWSWAVSLWKGITQPLQGPSLCGQGDLAPPLLVAFWKLQFPILMQTSAKPYREARGEREKKKSISIRCADIFHLCYSNFSHL